MNCVDLGLEAQMPSPDSDQDLPVLDVHRTFSITEKPLPLVPQEQSHHIVSMQSMEFSDEVASLSETLVSDAAIDHENPFGDHAAAPVQSCEVATVQTKSLKGISAPPLTPAYTQATTLPDTDFSPVSKAADPFRTPSGVSVVLDALASPREKCRH